MSLKKEKTQKASPAFSSGNKSASLAGVFAPSAASGAAARLGTLPWVFATCPRFLSPFLWVGDKLLNAFIYFFFVITANIRPRVVVLEESEHTLVSHAGAPAWSPGLFWDRRHTYAAQITRRTPDEVLAFLRILITPKGDVM